MSRVSSFSSIVRQKLFIIKTGIAQDLTSFLSNHKQANLAPDRIWLNDFVALSFKLLLGTFYSWYYFAVVSAVCFFSCFIMCVLHDTFSFQICTLVSFIINLLVELSSSSCLNVFCAWHVVLYIITLRVDSDAVFA